MKQTRTNKLLLTIFLATVIPTLVVYLEHAYIELEASMESISETKKIKTLSEFIFFVVIGLGYLVLTVFIIIFPQSRLPYLIVIVGTVAVVIFYFISRIYPIPIPTTDYVIRDTTIDWRDVITKICQQILVIPASMLLVRRS